MCCWQMMRGRQIRVDLASHSQGLFTCSVASFDEELI